VVHRFYPDVQVEFAFRNRTFAVALANRIRAAELEEEIEAYREVAFDEVELEWLADQKIFDPGYLSWLGSGHRLPPVKIGEVDGHLTATYEGAWADAVFWETPLLAIISQLYYRRFATNKTEGRERLHEKRKYLGYHRELQFIEFGSRRRHSIDWQEHVVESLKDTVPNMVGTSNAELARRYALPVVGTMAHQLTMVVSALKMAKSATNASLVEAHAEVASGWRELYGAEARLMTWLPDTYGTLFGMAVLEGDALDQFAGVRQDSGDPIKIGGEILHAWRRNDIEPHDKTLIFSDALDLRTMNLLYDRFAPETNVRFGWGTNLTNDLGFEPLSMVIKPNAVIVDGARHPCVKLSDNIAKATGPADAIELYKAAAGYDNDFTSTTRY
jgi:nicotinate phosphoribosyltransferase